MKKKVTRKEFLEQSAKYAAGITAGVVGLKALSPNIGRADTQTPPWPWPYSAIDPEAVRIAGHDLFWSGKACSAGAFGAIITELANVVGYPFTEIPMELMIFGHGGGAGWGTICGALNGSSAAISLVCDKPTSDLLINELLGWYTQTLFPSDIANQYAVNHTYGNNQCDIALPQNVSGSPLCHISVTNWCNEANYLVHDLERKERCARIAGDVPAYAVKILNDNLAGTFTPQYVPPATIAACMACHGQGFMDNVAAKMECEQCHGDPHAPQNIEEIGGVIPSGFELRQNYPNPFNPNTTIEFSVPRNIQVELTIFDIQGRRVKNLVPHKECTPGSYRVKWDATDNFGKRVASGTYFATLKAGAYSATKKMVLAR